jgi:PIN domain nuclease of toxin-antitoxin system
VILLLDTHVLHWWSIDAADMISPAAQSAIEDADELAVAAISWFELAWLAHQGRIVVRIPVRSWLQGLAQQVRTLGITPAIADIAVGLAASFPGDPADRLIYATAIDHGIRLVTRDERLRAHPFPVEITLW